MGGAIQLRLLVPGHISAKLYFRKYFDKAETCKNGKSFVCYINNVLCFSTKRDQITILFHVIQSSQHTLLVTIKTAEKLGTYGQLTEVAS